MPISIDELLSRIKEGENPQEIVEHKAQEIKEAISQRFNLSAVLLGGVYFLCDADNVLYIGETHCFAQRIASHIADNRIPFTRIEVIIECDDTKRLGLEWDMIKRYEPFYNKGRNKAAKNKNFGNRFKNEDYQSSWDKSSCIDSEFDT